MSCNSNLISIHHRWMDTYFSKDHVVEIDIETSRCVFRLPNATTQTKPEAYAPRRLGLGPYHHLRPELYKMQLHKISRVRKFLGPEKLEVFKEVVGDLVKREPVVRACYDEYLDFEMKALARILAVDALYLLQLLHASKNGEISDETMENLAADILMLENQIPVVILKVVLKVLQSHEIWRSEHVLSVEFGEFCEAHSPLQFHLDSQWIDKTQLHLLDRMYRSILIPIPSSLRFSGLAPPQILAMAERARKIREQLKGDEEVASSPTALELSETAGVKFERSPGGIRDIIYVADTNSLQLPTLKLDGNSEIVLRNLIAYEAAVGETLELAEYLDLMCGLIRTDKDVITLKKAQIIAGEVSDEGVVGVFDGIGRVVGGRRKNQSKLIVEDVSKPSDADADVDVAGIVKVKRFVKKWLGVTWRFVILVGAVAVLAVLVVQGFCSVFACGRWLGRSAAVQSFGYQ